MVLPSDDGFEALPGSTGAPRGLARGRRRERPSVAAAESRAASTASSRRAEQPAMATGGTVSVTMVLRGLGKRRPQARSR